MVSMNYEWPNGVVSGPSPVPGLSNLISLMRRVTRADDYQQWTKDFLGGA
jgi:hypothetical protein